MGAAISAFRDGLHELDDKEKARTKEQLDFLVKAANSKLDKYQNDLDDMFTDPATVEKRMVPGIRALRWERGYRVSVSEEAGEGLNDVVDGFFGMIKEGTSEKTDAEQKKDAVVGGFKKIVGGALKTILGNRNAGEQEEQKFFIFMKQNAVIRIDVKIWRYNFSGQGIMANTENVFCYIFCTSVVDSAKLKMDEFSYLLSEYAGDDGVQAYVEKLIEVWTSIAKMQKFINQTRLEIDRLKLGYPGHDETKVIEHKEEVTTHERKAITAPA
ncbi:hypothetical protein BKA70DRAFT_1236966 [Coprinopsis sp. MPI-PUGE-AT-0042]|nr:hypothetical protein BKA70DRAFT_1236966 [Coprinopsis sp. MPI-PUGE-AT-0042]